MSTCSRCQTFFECGMVEATGNPCWCAALPPLPADALDDADDTVCLCPSCLRERIAQRVAAATEHEIDGLSGMEKT